MTDTHTHTHTLVMCPFILIKCGPSISQPHVQSGVRLPKVKRHWCPNDFQLQHHTSGSYCQPEASIVMSCFSCWTVIQKGKDVLIIMLSKGRPEQEKWDKTGFWFKREPQKQAKLCPRKPAACTHALSLCTNTHRHTWLHTTHTHTKPSVWVAYCSLVWRTQYPSLVIEVRLIADKSVFSSSLSLRLTDLWQRLMERRDELRASLFAEGRGQQLGESMRERRKQKKKRRTGIVLLGSYTWPTLLLLLLLSLKEACLQFYVLLNWVTFKVLYSGKKK